MDVTTPGTVPFLAGLAQGVDWVIIGIDTELATAEGFVARIFQHEVDHTDGHVYLDRMPDLTTLAYTIVL